MKKALPRVYPQKIYALLRQVPSETLYDRKPNSAEMELIKSELHDTMKHLLPSSPLLPAKPNKHFDGTKKGGNVSPSTDSLQNVSQEHMQKNESIFTEDITITFDGKCFQFSGSLESGRREDAILVVEKLGGYSPSGNSLLTTLVNYLVVGNLEKHAPHRNGYGGNIDKAVNLNREARHSIQIIRECDFVKAVLKAITILERSERPSIETAITYRSLSERITKASSAGSKAVI